MTESTIATVTQSLSTPLPPPSGWLRFRTWALRTPLMQFIVLIALSAILVALVPAFIARPQAAISVLVLASLLALAAMGQTLVVILGGLDLAIIGYVTFGAMIWWYCSSAEASAPASAGCAIGSECSRSS